MRPSASAGRAWSGLIGLGVSCLWAWSAGAAPEPEGGALSNLAWLAGCWENAAADRRLEEQWMQPRAGMMLGMSRTVGAESVREFEFLQIREEGGRLVFTARPSGQPEATFSSILVTPSKVVFENPTHDFPQRIIYMRAADDSLLARIEGELDGKTQGRDFPMHRSKCADGGNR